MSQIGLIVAVFGIAVLFLLERDKTKRPSIAILLPLVWILIAGSRNVGEWLHVGMPVDPYSEAYIDGNPFDRNLLSVLVAIGFVILLFRRQKVWALLKSNWPVVLYFGYCLLSLAWSDYPFVGFKRWIRAIGDIMMILIVLTDFDWLLARKRLYAWAGFLLIPVSVMLIRYFPEYGRVYSPWDGQVSWTGVTENKNELGMICMIFGLASLSRVLDVLSDWKHTKQKGQLIANGLVFLTAIWLLSVAHSATSTACFAIGTALLVLTRFRIVMRRMAIVHILVLVFLGGIVSSLFLGIGTEMVTYLGRDSSLTGRTAMWQHALGLVRNPVLGEGFESFWVGPREEEMRAVAPGVNQAHNAYIEVYLNLGWVGVFLLGILIVKGYQMVISAFRRNPELGRLGLTFFVIALSYGVTEAGAVKFRNPVWISLLIAMLSASLIKSAQEETSREIPAVPELPKYKGVALPAGPRFGGAKGNTPIYRFPGRIPKGGAGF